MLVGQQVDVEGLFNGRDRAFDLDFHAVARSADNRKAVLLNVLHNRIIMFLRGTKPGGEFGRGEEVTVVGDGRAVQIGQEGVETSLIAHRQNDVQLYDLSGGKVTEQLGLPVECGFAYVASHQRFSAGRDGSG